MINWHRLFGLTLSDYFTGTQYTVEMEKDLARKRQVLDVLIVRGEGPPLAEPCDGLEGLRPHNLLTYKSGQESLDDWAIEELIGHYVNYRKAFAPKIPREDFGLYAISTRHPKTLLHGLEVSNDQAGVYRLRVLHREITLIVPKEVEAHPRNALWELFSFEAEKVALGMHAYQWRQPDHIPLIQEIYQRYRELGVAMSYTFTDFRRDVAREVLPELPPEERLRGLPPEERLRGLPPEEVLKRFSPEDILRGLGEDGLARLMSLLEKQGKLHS